MSNHFSAGICWRLREGSREVDEESLEALILEYSEAGRDGVHNKFPGGTNREFPQETPTDTLWREWNAETGLTIVRLNPQPVRSVPKFGGHVQHYFGIDPGDCEGELRTVPKTDIQADRPTEFLGPPEYRAVKRLLLPGGMFPPHQQVLQTVLPKFIEYVRKFPKTAVV